LLFDAENNLYICPGGKELRKYHRAFAQAPGRALERSGFVAMKMPPIEGGAALGRGTRADARQNPCQWRFSTLKAAGAVL
jgi:hypothetical protein